MKLLLINQSFYPDVDATGQMMTDLAEDLVEYGIDVTVITGRNQKNASETEVYNGVSIFRVNVLRLSKKILLFRYLNYLSLFPSIILKALFMPKPDYILMVSSPPFMYFIGWFLKLLKASKLILNVQDLYPDVAVKLGLLKTPWIIKILENLTIKMYKRADKIICIGETMRKLLVDRGVQPDKIEMVHNWADGKQLFPMEKRDDHFAVENGFLHKFVIQYSGNFGMVHEIDTVLETAKKLSNNSEILFVFIGDGVQANKIRSFIKENRLLNILVFPYQPRKGLNFSLNACDISLVTLKDGFQGIVVPSKIYGIMATGKPVFVICPPDSEVGKIVNENACGVVVDPGNVDGCVRGILRLFQNEKERRAMGERAHKVFLEKYDRPLGTQRYFKVISSV